MEITKMVHMRARKGFGPEWINKDLEITFDDVEAGTPECEINDMFTAQAKTILKQKGYLRYYILSIESV